MKYDLVLTSCRRNDLLSVTLSSFQKYADIQPDKVYVIEDSDNYEVEEIVRAIYPSAIIINNVPQLGQMKSIRKIYGYSSADYIFHCEDDWEFFRTGFIADSFQLLNVLPKASLVSLRPRSELHPLEKSQPKLVTPEGLQYFTADPTSHPEWFSYSFNPGLRRRADLYEVSDIDSYPSEAEISLAFKQQGFYLSFLEEPAVKHIGGGRHVQDPSRPPKAKTFIARMKRSYRKRMDRLMRRLIG